VSYQLSQTACIEWREPGSFRPVSCANRLVSGRDRGHEHSFSSTQWLPRRSTFAHREPVSITKHSGCAQRRLRSVWRPTRYVRQRGRCSVDAPGCIQAARSGVWPRANFTLGCLLSGYSASSSRRIGCSLYAPSVGVGAEPPQIRDQIPALASAIRGIGGGKKAVGSVHWTRSKPEPCEADP
jgi:hypothetical protein